MKDDPTLDPVELERRLRAEAAWSETREERSGNLSLLSKLAVAAGRLGHEPGSLFLPPRHTRPDARARRALRADGALRHLPGPQAWLPGLGRCVPAAGGYPAPGAAGGAAVPAAPEVLAHPCMV